MKQQKPKGKKREKKEKKHKENPTKYCLPIWKKSITDKLK